MKNLTLTDDEFEYVTNILSGSNDIPKGWNYDRYMECANSVGLKFEEAEKGVMIKSVKEDFESRK